MASDTDKLNVDSIIQRLLEGNVLESKEGSNGTDW